MIIIMIMIAIIIVTIGQFAEQGDLSVERCNVSPYMLFRDISLNFQIFFQQHLVNARIKLDAAIPSTYHQGAIISYELSTNVRKETDLRVFKNFPTFTFIL